MSTAADESKGDNVARLKRIARISVKRLFGYANYTLPKKDGNPGDLSRFFIIYGDNGAGKTTILKTVFRLLSPQDGMGHKSAIARTPFQSFAVELNDGTVVEAQRLPDSLTGSFDVRVGHKGTTKSKFTCVANERGHIATNTSPESAELLKELQKISPTMFLLPDDRRIQTTLESEDLRKRYRVIPKVTFGGEFDTGDDDTQSAHHLDIEPTLIRLASWIRTNAIAGTNQGATNANVIYADVIRRLSGITSAREHADREQLLKLRRKVDEIGKRSPEFQSLGLSTPFSTDEFSEALATTSAARRATVISVLSPFLEGVEARLNALEEIKSVVSRFVRLVNGFFTRKAMSFSLSRGFAFRNDSGQDLQPNMLSSGEKQLLFILGNSILARESPTIFLIDEPEISLNIKWQRRLLNAVSDVSEGAEVQFVFASHALEIISKYRPQTVRL